MMKYKAKKRFGQNFLSNPAVLNKIIDISHITEETLVIEIGPGKGALTDGLLRKAKKVLAYEIDRDLIKYLKIHFRERTHLSIIEGDFLNRDVELDRSSQTDIYEKTIVVANIPYYITSPIITKILTEYKHLDRAVIMVQEEVARRFTALPKTKEYGALTVITNYYANVEYGFGVPKKYFNPQPKVDSAVIVISPLETRKYSRDEEKAFITFVKYSFSQKRKTWANNLLNHYKIDKKILEDALINEGLDANVRAEAASLEQFMTFFDILNQNHVLSHDIATES